MEGERGTVSECEIERERERKRETQSTHNGGWRPRDPRAAVSKLETQESRWCRSSVKAGRVETQEEPLFWSHRKRPRSRPQTGGVPSYS